MSKPMRIHLAMVLTSRFEKCGLFRRSELCVGGHVSWEVLWPLYGAGNWSEFPRTGGTILRLVGEPFHPQTLEEWKRSHIGYHLSMYDPRAWQKIQVSFEL